MIAIGSDHAGYSLKEEVKKHLTELALNFVDFGTFSDESCDYPEFALAVAENVACKKADKGILICGTGIGVSISANKVKGIRCALCSDLFSAEATRKHNNANVLAMGARVISRDLALQIVDAFIATQFEGGRHQNRLDKITNIENKYMK